MIYICGLKTNIKKNKLKYKINNKYYQKRKENINNDTNNIFYNSLRISL